ncbi:hypothetical protein NL676_006393 [Syzygium grande]|nr:hypothetical protein NL676_006393 [Syzygium grande]
MPRRSWPGSKCTFPLNADCPKPRSGQGWLRRAMYYTEECIDKFHLREARERSRVLHMAALVSKYKLWSDLSILVNKMKESCDEKFLKEEAEGKSKEKPASSSSLASDPWQGPKLARLTSFWDPQAPTNFLRREEQKKEIRKRIKWGRGSMEFDLGRARNRQDVPREMGLQPSEVHGL